MKTIEINGKEYPFIISAANARLNTQIATKAQNKELEDSEAIDHYMKMIHMGLKDGRLTLPFWKRLFCFIPSQKRLEHIIPIDRMITLVTGRSFPEVDNIPKEEDEGEKKP